MNRLIPCLLLKNGHIVRSELFKTHQIIGNPISTVERLSGWNVDELIILDISEDDYHDLRRDDLHIRYKGTRAIDLLEQIAERCYMPLIFGGRIRSVQDIEARLVRGADKVSLNTAIVGEPGLVSAAARRWGSQCIVASIDAKKTSLGYEAFIERGRVATGQTAAAMAARAEELGAGEILLNSIDRDGAAIGIDIDLVRSVTEAVSIPVIACGGVGKYGDFVAPIREGGADAVAAGNIFHFFELSYPLAKEACLRAGLDMRPVKLNSAWFPREPEFDSAREDDRLANRIEKSFSILRSTDTPRPSRMTWCRNCVYPYVSAAPLQFDETGLCSGCSVSMGKITTDHREWDLRLNMLRDTIEANRCPKGSRHDCVIGVSGGKDSYFQVHTIKNVLGFNPLLVTYYGNNYSSEGHYNLYRMKEVFDVDHIIYQPGVDTLVRLNRLCFAIMGDMNWHNHVGIATIPMKIAAQFGIPLVIWGEHGYMDLAGQFSMNDFVEFTYRNRLEHWGRSFEWTYFVGREGLTPHDLWAWQYPDDETIHRVGLRGLFLANYVKWEANEHGKMVRERYGFKIAERKFERTYRLMSNLDDIHENGLHDYLKYVKFGYGRCTDHASKDIRAGILSREEGIDLVRAHDHVVPSDLARWLEYTGMAEEEFHRVADSFRDPRVWWKESGAWRKDNLWD